MRVGDVFGWLTVLELVKGGKARVRCECGAEKTVRRSNLKQSATTSCGCRASQQSSARLKAMWARAAQ
jgi:hypothetical protein